MPRLSSTGKALMGVAGGMISVDGSTPTELSGFIGGYWDFLSDDLIAGPASNGGGAWQLWQDTLSTGTTASLSTFAAGQFYAGNSKYAAFLASTPSEVQSNVSGLSSISGAGLGTVSREGQPVLIDSYQGDGGLTVYSSSGATLLALPVKIIAPYIFLVNGTLAYEDATGWHLVTVATGAIPRWAPQLPVRARTIPVVFGSTLYLVEQSGTDTVTIRAATSAQGFVVNDVLNGAYNIAAVGLTSTTIRIAWSTNAGESAEALVEADVNPVTGAWTKSTVVAGVLVPVVQTPLTLTNFTLGPLEGNNLSNAGYLPDRHKVLQADGTADPLWLRAWQATNDRITTVQTFVQKIPTPTPPPDGFGIVQAPTQPPLAATIPDDTLTITSADGSVQFLSTPNTNTLDVRVAAGRAMWMGMPGEDGEDGLMGPPGPAGSGNGSSASYVPVSTGAEPLVIVSNGAGSVLLTPYTP